MKSRDRNRGADDLDIVARIREAVCAAPDCRADSTRNQGIQSRAPSD